MNRLEAHRNLFQNIIEQPEERQQYRQEFISIMEPLLYQSGIVEWAMQGITRNPNYKFILETENTQVSINKVGNNFYFNVHYVDPQYPTLKTSINYNIDQAQQRRIDLLSPEQLEVLEFIYQAQESLLKFKNQSNV